MARKAAPNSPFAAELLKKLKRLIARRPEPPADPYSYVTAPKRPRPPYRDAAAVAEHPGE